MITAVSTPAFILMDIEGTTTEIAFVHDVLFPYAAERLSGFIALHGREETVQRCLEAVQETILAEESRQITVDECVETLLKWTRQDRKHTALKRLQGLIWKAGFEAGDYQGHVYSDVPLALAQWQDQGIAMGIYSSGSVQAQQLLFGYSVFGDLTPYFSAYFDTAVGGKRSPDSYLQIATTLDRLPQNILFLSDIEEEISAALQAGMQAVQLVREAHSMKNLIGEKVALNEQNPVRKVTSFSEISFLPVAPCG